MDTQTQFEKIWEAITSTVKSYCEESSSQIDAFFSRIHIQAMSGNFIALTAESDFIKDWVNKYYLKFIQQALQEIFGEEFVILFETYTQQTQNEILKSNKTSSLQQNKEVQKNKTDVAPEFLDSLSFKSNKFGNKETYSINVNQNNQIDNHSNNQNNGQNFLIKNSSLTQEHVSPDQVDENILLHSFSPLTFENFVIGNSNQMAYKMALAVAEAPGKKVGLNPLFIYGKSGLGKTHLLRSIENHVIESFPKFKVVYVDSSEFLDEYTEASAAHDKNKYSFNNFKKRYEQADVLLIDDVQFFQGKKGTLDNMFQIFNKLTSKGKQVVLSADRAPKNIDIDERYRSRFQSGGTFDIQPPEIETKISIIKNYIEEYKASDINANFTITSEMQQCIAETSSSNIRELKGAVTVVISSLLTNPYMNIESLKQLLQNHFDNSNVGRLSISDIQEAVESFYKVSHSDLIGKKRSQNIAYPRQIGMFLCRELLDDIPFKEIGKAFGRDHSTAVYSYKNTLTKRKESRQTQEEIEALEHIIENR